MCSISLKYDKRLRVIKHYTLNIHLCKQLQHLRSLPCSRGLRFFCDYTRSATSLFRHSGQHPDESVVMHLPHCRNFAADKMLEKTIVSYFFKIMQRERYVRPSNPSCRQKTWASLESHLSSQTEPHNPSRHISTLPSEDVLPSTRQTSEKHRFMRNALHTNRQGIYAR